MNIHSKQQQNARDYATFNLFQSTTTRSKTSIAGVAQLVGIPSLLQFKDAHTEWIEPTSERDVFRKVLWPRTNEKTGVSNKHCGVRACAELPPLRSYSNVPSVDLGGNLLRFCG
jgi:hypothetical protein